MEPATPPGVTPWLYGRVARWLAEADGPQTVAQIRRGTQVTPETIRKYLRLLGAETTGPPGSLAYHLPRAPAKCQTPTA